MTIPEFQRLPMLLDRQQVQRTLGYSMWTVRKMTDAGVLRGVRPKGVRWYRWQKKQVADVAGLAWIVEQDWRRMQQEPLLMAEKAVTNWTGYSKHTLERIVRAGGLTRVRAPGNGTGRFRKVEICELVGFPDGLRRG